MKRALSIVILSFIYSITYIISKIMGFIWKGGRHERCVLINGTFHNPNWFKSHIEPIVKSDYGKVVLVTDKPLDDYDNLYYECPPPQLAKYISRAGAKFVWTLKAAFTYKPSILVGYHIFPSAITALIAAKMIGAKACYQVTSGQLELEGGGHGAENKLLVNLGYHSSLIESLASAVVTQFDIVIVRGSRAKYYIESIGYKGPIEIVTGSVLTDSKYIKDNREVDVIFVGRLAEYKRPDHFVRVIRGVIQNRPDTKVVMVGDGPDRTLIEKMIEEYQLKDNIRMLGRRSDIPELLGNSKILVLTSRWEGVSIAMLEGMALGVVPVVSDVGDLKDFVEDGHTGFTFRFGEEADARKLILRLLDNNDTLERMSKNSRDLVKSRCSKNVLSMRWKNILNDMTD